MDSRAGTAAMLDAGGATISDETVTVDGNRIHYLTGGTSGPPLVLLHGGIIDAAHISWGELLGPLAEQTRVYALDLPGYGTSEMPDGPLTMESQVDAVRSFLDTVDIEDPVVAGTSMGGGIAIGLALAHPDCLSQVVALEPFALGSQLPNGLLTWLLAKVQVTNHLSVALMRRSRGFVEQSLDGLTADSSTLSEATVDRVIAEVKRPGAGAAFRKFRAAEVTWHGYRTDYSDRVSELSVPVQYVHGAEDDLLPPRWSERAAERTPADDLHILDECGHLAPLERPGEVAAIIRDTL
ncbi:alpha/beta fold hydrolase [Salinibaculum rarum]|uniref:alpha/beta fold hydrolase n=1 Tax=Salinibaculum rarum TaxID=3058903 RepID=UPI00265E899A|nr:alpha/beta fold hydrolase [Salinibaculum sp. KK48]